MLNNVFDQCACACLCVCVCVGVCVCQIIQRQLEQVEEKQRQLEERGVAVEKALRGEAGRYTRDAFLVDLCVLMFVCVLLWSFMPDVLSL